MDVTIRKTVAEKLRESENLYRAIFETTGTATIIIEEDKTISLLNSEFEKMTGYRREEWEGKKQWTEYVAPKDVPGWKATTTPGDRTPERHPEIMNTISLTRRGAFDTCISPST